MRVNLLSGQETHPAASTLLHLNQAFCSSWITALQFHGLAFGLVLGTLWALSGWVRLQELRRLRRRSLKPGAPLADLPLGSLAEQRQAPAQLTAAGTSPRVAVVLPTRGCREHSVDNWRAMLGLQYNGPVEFVFVIQDQADAAYAAVSQLLLTTALGAREARIVFSGKAVATSQKIHNLLAGVAAASPSADYVLCLDDDLHLHPGAVSWLVAGLEADDTLRVASGYPFDVPPPRASLLTYAVLSYHLPLVIAMSLRQRTDFVWGGCMLFRGEDLRGDGLGILAAWADGGYSDDLTVAAKCTELGLKVYCPSYSIFPQWLEDIRSPSRYWNYLRRQLYPLDTYVNAHARRTNHTMALLHCYGSWGFVLPAALAAARLALWAVTLAAALLTLTVHGRWAAAGGEGSTLPELLGAQAGCGWGVLSLAAFTASAVYAAAGLGFMTGVVLSLFMQLDPSVPRSRLHCFEWPKLWLAFCASNALLPLCMAYTFATDHIEWGSIWYRRRGGKVVSVCHEKPGGE